MTAAGAFTLSESWLFLFLALLAALLDRYPDGVAPAGIAAGIESAGGHSLSAAQ